MRTKVGLLLEEAEVECSAALSAVSDVDDTVVVGSGAPGGSSISVPRTTK